MTLNEISEPISIMEHQLQEAIKRQDHTLTMAYVTQLRNYLTIVLGKEEV